MLVRWLALLRVPRYTVFHRRLEKKSIRDSLLKGLGFQPHRKYREINGGFSRRGKIRSSSFSAVCQSFTVPGCATSGQADER